ncbi:MAG: Mur ligase family protein [Francisellaceae bacterium]
MKTFGEIVRFLKKLRMCIYSSDVSVDSEQVIISQLNQDHRQLKHGDLFIAMKGQQFDGHAYIEEAIGRGAVAVICEDLAKIKNEVLDLDKIYLIEVKDIRAHLSALSSWFYDDPCKNFKHCIGVTGTNGKTTISYFITQLLAYEGNKVAFLGTIGNGIYPGLEISSHTTLDAVSLQGKLRQFVDENANDMVMEVSSHALDQKRVANVNFDVAVFSNLDGDHLDYHGTLEHYFTAKKKLFEFDSIKMAVINIDDIYGQRLAKELSFKRKKIISTSIQDPEADCYIRIDRVKNSGMDITLFWYGQPCFSTTVDLMGAYNIANLASAVAVFLLLKIPSCRRQKIEDRRQGGMVLEYNNTFFTDLLNAVFGLRPAPGRMEMLKRPGEPVVIIDFAHTSDALKKALVALKTKSKGRLYCVFGCGGDRDRRKRAKMAKCAQRLADFIVITEDNNRLESFDSIIEDMMPGLSDKKENYRIIPDRKKAIEYALNQATKEDIVLLAGKGHERYIDHSGEKEPFDEREIVQHFWSRKHRL